MCEVVGQAMQLDNPDSRWMQAQKGYSGRLVVGQDLLQLGIGRKRR